MKLLPLALTLSLALSSSAFAAQSPFVLNPYTFVGRITDARGSAFDADRKATLYARDLSSNLLARASTFRRDDTPNNYALVIPMSSVASSTAAATNQLLDVSVLDDLGKTWNAVIDPARVGAPGAVSTVDIALVEDLDGDGIDDDLYRELEAIWLNTRDDPSSTPYSPASADSDGDGVSDLAEALAGTDPSNPGDVLSILSFDPATGSVTFVSAAGRAYTLEAASSLSDPAWTPASTTLYTPSAPPSATNTLYLSNPSAPAPLFFRLAVH